MYQNGEHKGKKNGAHKKRTEMKANDKGEEGEDKGVR
jgi:hypothetical protein